MLKGEQDQHSMGAYVLGPPEGYAYCQPNPCVEMEWRGREGEMGILRDKYFNMMPFHDGLERNYVDLLFPRLPQYPLTSHWRFSNFLSVILWDFSRLILILGFLHYTL